MVRTWTKVFVVSGFEMPRVQRATMGERRQTLGQLPYNPRQSLLAGVQDCSPSHYSVRATCYLPTPYLADTIRSYSTLFGANYRSTEPCCRATLTRMTWSEQTPKLYLLEPIIFDTTNRRVYKVAVFGVTGCGKKLNHQPSR